MQPFIQTRPRTFGKLTVSQFSVKNRKLNLYEKLGRSTKTNVFRIYRKIKNCQNRLIRPLIE